MQKIYNCALIYLECQWQRSLYTSIAPKFQLIQLDNNFCRFSFFHFQHSNISRKFNPWSLIKLDARLRFSWRYLFLFCNGDKFFSCLDISFCNWINPTVAWDVILIWRKDRGSSANLFKWSIRPNLEQEREKPQKLSICDSSQGMGIGSVYFLKQFFILLLLL